MKKKLEIREGRHEQCKHTSTPWNYSLSLDLFPMKIQKDFLLFFIMPPLNISSLINEKKKLEIRKGRHDQCKHTSTQWNYFLSLDLFPMNIQKDFLLLFIMPP